MERAVHALGGAPVAEPALPHAPEATRPSAARVRARRAQAAQAAQAKKRHSGRRIGIVSLWQGVVIVIGQQAASIVTIAMLGFAAPVIFGLFILKLVAVEGYRRMGFAAFIYDKPSHAALFVQAVVCILSFAFARGAITWLSLHGRNWREACRAAASCYPALLFGSLIYAALIVAGVVGLHTLLYALRLGPDRVSQVAITFDGAVRLTAAQSLHALMPDSGVPSGLIERWHTASHPEPYTRVEIMPGLFETYDNAPSPAEPSFWLVTLGCVAAIVIVETLLRFRTIAALAAKPPRRWNVLARLIAHIRLSARRFGVIALHIWLLRLTAWVLSVTCIIAPAVVSQNFSVALAGRTIGWVDVHALVALASAVSAVSIAIVNALVAAASVIYDAQLYRALQGEGEPEAEVGAGLPVVPAVYNSRR